ncbi:radical SAM protein [Poriferisphaera sp. WC338]|uniref:radical SAM protein n=1 Tax=Poriferisphaera sp. WC338 TaxID=3425129 RepID=UPI003D818DD7
MFSVSNILANHAAGNEDLRYGHTHRDRGTIKSEHKLYPDAPRPVVVWAVTRACNLRCVHCYASADANPAPNELPHEEGIALLDDLKAFNVPAVLFSGGEPLSRPDTLELIAYAKSLGINCTLSTNGLLIDDATAHKLADIGLKYAGISIDGLRETHDKLRGLKGAFDQTLTSVKRCKDAGLKVGARFTVHALNMHQLDDIIDLSIEHNIDRLCVYHLAYSGRGGKMQKVDLTSDQTREVIERIFERTAELHKLGTPLEVLTVGNHADAAYAILNIEKTDPDKAAQIHEQLRGTGGNRSGSNISSIDPMGNVHYDQFSWHYNCGNIRDKKFSQIWAEATDPRLAQLRDRKAMLPEKCQGCRFLDICNGNLRTRAEAATEDWLGMDPSCYLNDEEIHSQPAATSAT